MTGGFHRVERIWGWIKPKVYGFSAVGDMDELLKRFRKLVWHFNERIPRSYLLIDLLSFQRFTGITFETEIPDYSTIWRFKEQLSKAGLLETIFHRDYHVTKTSTD